MSSQVDVLVAAVPQLVKEMRFRELVDKAGDVALAQSPLIFSKMIAEELEMKPLTVYQRLRKRNPPRLDSGGNDGIIGFMAYEFPQTFLCQLGSLIRSESGPAGADVEERFLAALALTPQVLPEVDTLMHAAPEALPLYARMVFESGVQDALTAAGVVEPDRVADFINRWLGQEVLSVKTD